MVWPNASQTCDHISGVASRGRVGGADVPTTRVSIPNIRKVNIPSGPMVFLKKYSTLEGTLPQIIADPNTRPAHKTSIWNLTLT